MQIRILIVVVTVFGLVAQAPVFAASKRSVPDGCPLLATSVRVAVGRAAHDSHLIHPRVGVWQAPDDGRFAEVPIVILRCGDTARVASEAFTAAFKEMGLNIHWGGFPPDSGDFCDSHYLSECYPRPVYMSSPMAVPELRLINETWKAVDKSVGGFMPYGIASDISRFDPEMLQLSMFGAIAVYVDAPQMRRRLNVSDQANAF